LLHSEAKGLRRANGSLLRGPRAAYQFGLGLGLIIERLMEMCLMYLPV
jgi:hypothetical protein